MPLNSNESVCSHKNESSVINHSPSCCSKPIRPSFIFRAQIKIFWMKSGSFLTLHRQQRMRCGILVKAHWRLTRKRRNSWIKSLFLFSLHKERYSRRFIQLRLNHWCHMDYFNDVLTLTLERVSSEDELMSYGFGMTRGWVINDHFHFWVTFATSYDRVLAL